MHSLRDKLHDKRPQLLTSIQQEQGSNVGLWLDRYIPLQDRNDTQGRRDFVKEVSLLPLSKIYSRYYNRWVKTLEESGVHTHKATVKGRMIVGLGDESVLETSVALHHTYGVPYIPGSALKGLAANYAAQRLGETWKKESEAYKIVFGNTDDAGYVTFFDALYIPGTDPKKNGQVLYPDVITVHHQKYYQPKSDVPPADWDSPIPVPFLSATGSYLIALAAPELDEPDIWLTRTFEILANALHERGIGAKTSSGYGRMEIEGVAITQANVALHEVPSASQTMPQSSTLAPYVRPRIPKFGAGQGIQGKVVAPTDELRATAPDAKSFLRYQEWSPNMVLIIVNAEEAAQWLPGQIKNCLFVNEEERNGCTVLLCSPGAGKKKKKG